MKLDTHLLNLAQQYINAHGNAPEQKRLQDAALEHLMNRSVSSTPYKVHTVSFIEAFNKWANLIGVLSI